ncbi:unnamed protein product [Polarella glacialis]|uniref:Uncharacterized protein n=1 Tax=Polarella glacialis TaxID=89957 RepID=A0A813FCV1_POLGL|nr:unnamed protein product [Polarella glacialis]
MKCDASSLEDFAHKQRSRVGLGLHVEVGAEDSAASQSGPLESAEVPLATAEDVKIVQKHIDDLRIATGVAPIVDGSILKIYGRGEKLQRAQQLVQTLLVTGEWVGFSGAFVLSEETKEKKRACDGPSEQLLIKLPECPELKVVERHLHSMEKAAEADQLKLTSKPIAGKRTLMVEGHKAAHERVKLMVKELMETGESAMLTKFLSGSKVGVRTAAVAFSDSFSASANTPAAAAARTAAIPATPSSSSRSSGGVICAPPVLTGVAPAPAPAPEKKPLPQLGAGFRLLAPPTRVAASAPPGIPDETVAAAPSFVDLFGDLPAPVPAGRGGDFFVGLPPPEAASDAAVLDMYAAAENQLKTECAVQEASADGITE